MNRDEYLQRRFRVDPEVDEKHMEELLTTEIRKDRREKDYDCTHLQTMAIEELAELQKEIAKYLRFKGWTNRDTIGIEEEMADVIIILNYLRLIHEIPKENITRGINVKLERLERKQREEGRYM